ncbi:MAG TPA: gamma-glutamyltransferase [Oscillatoriaceae cyanobacterium]
MLPRLLASALIAAAATGAVVPTFTPSPAPTPAPIPLEWPYRHPAPAVEAAHGAVASDSILASRVGVGILREGGNAVDAAIAVAFALAVVYPQAGNLGGGGFMVIRQANGRTAALDYRETAPARATRDMFLDSAGNRTNKSLVGPLAAGVPGTVAGLVAAHRRYGRLPWAKLVAPAIDLAAKGFVVDAKLADTFGHDRDLLLHNDATRHAYSVDGHLPYAGDRLVQPELANTLRRIAAQGARGFYAGPVAAAIAHEQAHDGGVISTADLARYQARWRTPVSFTYRGYRLISMPPPSSGGVTLAEMLNILEGVDLRAMGWHSPAEIHWMAEASRRAFADRNAYLGDPDFVTNPVATLMSKAYAAKRRATIKPDVATPEAGKQGGLEPTHTTHFDIVDRDGNAVSNTTTLNNDFGSGVVVPGTGVLLNDEMDDFTAKPGTPNLFGLVQGTRNAIAPGKRMLSSMTPTIVLDPKGRLFLVIGSPGGSTIISTVTQVIVNMIDFGMPLNAAIAAPRQHHQALPDQIDLERGGFSPTTLSALIRMNHAIHEREAIGDAMGIARLENGKLAAVADPRRDGAAAGY